MAPSEKGVPSPRASSAPKKIDLEISTGISLTERKSTAAHTPANLKATALPTVPSKSKLTPPSVKSIRQAESKRKSIVTKPLQPTTPSPKPILKPSAASAKMPLSKRKLTIVKPLETSPAPAKSISPKLTPIMELKTMEKKSGSRLSLSTNPTSPTSGKSPISASSSMVRSRLSFKEQSFESSSPKRAPILAGNVQAGQEKELGKGSPSPPFAAGRDDLFLQKHPASPGSKKKRVRSTSFTKMMNARFGKGGFTRREGLIGFGFWFIVIVYTFTGSHICKSVDGNVQDDKNTVWPCAYSDIANCSNATRTIDDRINSSTTADNDTISIINFSEMTSSPTNGSELECTADPDRNETWRMWDECLFDKQQNAVPNSYVEAISYTVTVVTTIGYGDAVGIGGATQAIVLFFSLITVPMFFDFVAFITELLRNELAFIYNQAVEKVLRKKKDSAGKQSAFAQFISNYRDLILFVIFVIITAGYLFATAGLLLAISWNGEHQEYFSACYYLLQSVLMLGSGNQSARDYQRHLVSSVFIIVGIILVTLVHLVMEEWMSSPLISIVDQMTSAVKEEKPMAEQTMEEMVPLKPNEVQMPAEEEELLARHGTVRHQRSFRLQSLLDNESIAYSYEENLPPIL